MIEGARERAIELVAAGKLTSEQIAAEVGVTRRTITSWKADKEFQQEVKTAKNAWRAQARHHGPADKDWRLRNSNDLLIRLRALILQRSKDPAMQHVPGGKTGLLTVTYKMQSMGEGLGSEAKAEYHYDTAVVESILNAQEHLATIKGEWNAKVKHEVSDGALAVLSANLAAGRRRVAEAKARNDAARAAAAGQSGSAD